MKILNSFFAALLFFSCFGVQAAITSDTSKKYPVTILPLKNKLALTPPMCFSTWNTFKMKPTEGVFKGIADMIVEKKFKDAGYQYVNIDEGWAYGRDANGWIISDSTKFPHGMKALADYIHSKGLKAGIYTNMGTTGKGDLGSRGHYDQDMGTFASWGYDYLKVDVNFIKNKEITDLSVEFAEVSKAIKNCGRPMVFSICNQGVGRDIDYLSWVEPYQKIQWRSFMYEVDRSMSHPAAARQGAWNDADTMLVGVTKESNRLTLLTPYEAKSHFSLWFEISSPLNICADIRNISEQAKDIRTYKEAIVINQDVYEGQACLVNNIDSLRVYAKHLESTSSGKLDVILFNRTEKPVDTTVAGSMLGLTRKFLGRNLWRKQNMVSFTNYTVNVPPHGVVFFKNNIKLTSLL